jgi:hypothetical protein
MYKITFVGARRIVIAVLDHREADAANLVEVVGDDVGGERLIIKVRALPSVPPNQDAEQLSREVEEVGERGLLLRLQP